jgi:hypothetical protein
MKDNELTSLLDRNEIYYGELISNTLRAEGFANFHVNPLRPNEMRVQFSHLSGNYMQLLADESLFHHEEESFTVSAKIRGQSGLRIISGRSDAQIGMTVDDGVDEFAKLINYNFVTDPIVASTTFQFFGPLPPILVGRESWHSNKIQVGGIEITVSEESYIEERANSFIGTPTKIAYREGKMEFDLPGTLEESETKAHELADFVDKALSIFSQDMISWHRGFTKRFNAGHQPISEQELIRWAVRPKGVRTDYRPTGGPLSDSVGILANAITTLPADKKDIFEKIFRCFRNAWLAPYYELWLIVWHACLDGFKDYYEAPGIPFSPNLVKACEKANVTFTDHFTNDRQRLLSGAEKFKFNELRNEYLHRGMIIEDFHTTMREIEKMKSLSYRFLFRFLNLDEHFCGLDSTYIP